MYNPTLGRFIERDPTVYEGGDENLYRYCDDNPLVHTDPTGNSMAPPRPILPETPLQILSQHFSTCANCKRLQENMANIESQIEEFERQAGMLSVKLPWPPLTPQWTEAGKQKRLAELSGAIDRLRNEWRKNTPNLSDIVLE